MTDGFDRYDLLSYPVRLQSGTVAEGAVDVDEEAAASDRARAQKLAPLVVVGIVLVLGPVYYRWGFAVALGVAYAGFGLAVLVSSENEVVETEVRAVPAGTGERVVAAHEAEARRKRRVRRLALAVIALFTAAVGYVAGTPRGLVPVGGLAVLLTVGAVAESKHTSEVFAPELVREGVSRQIAEAEATTVTESPLSPAGVTGSRSDGNPMGSGDGATAPPESDSGRNSRAERR